MTLFPGALDNFTNPSPTSRMNVLSHSGEHSDSNDAVEALERKVGVDNSTDPDSLDYKVAQLEESVGGVASVIGVDNRIVVTGTATNPIVNIAPTYVGQGTITTLGTIATGVWEATDVGLAHGGTGATLTDPGADRILFWDESENTVTWLQAGAGIDITGTTISSTAGGVSFGDPTLIPYMNATEDDFDYGTLATDGDDLILDTSIRLKNDSDELAVRNEADDGYQNIAANGAKFASDVTAATGYYLPPQTAPSNPATSGEWVLYSDNDDSTKLKAKKSDGTTVDLTAGGTGDVSSNTSTSANNELILFADTTGKLVKRATGSGLATITSGVLSTTTAPSGAIVGTTDTQTLTGKTINGSSNTLTVITSNITNAAVTSPKVALTSGSVAGNNVNFSVINNWFNITSVTINPSVASRVLIVANVYVVDSALPTSNYQIRLWNNTLSTQLIITSASKDGASGIAGALCIPITFLNNIATGSQTIILQGRNTENTAGSTTGSFTNMSWLLFSQ